MRKPEQEHEMKPLVWVGSSHEDLKAFPQRSNMKWGTRFIFHKKEINTLKPNP